MENKNTLTRVGYAAGGFLAGLGVMIPINTVNESHHTVHHTHSASTAKENNNSTDQATDASEDQCMITVNKKTYDIDSYQDSHNSMPINAKPPLSNKQYVFNDMSGNAFTYSLDTNGLANTNGSVNTQDVSNNSVTEWGQAMQTEGGVCKTNNNEQNIYYVNIPKNDVALAIRPEIYQGFFASNNTDVTRINTTNNNPSNAPVTVDAHIGSKTLHIYTGTLNDLPDHSQYLVIPQNQVSNMTFDVTIDHKTTHLNLFGKKIS